MVEISDYESREIVREKWVRAFCQPALDCIRVSSRSNTQGCLVPDSRISSPGAASLQGRFRLWLLKTSHELVRTHVVHMKSATLKRVDDSVLICRKSLYEIDAACHPVTVPL